MGMETSPVKAPSFSQWAFWAATVIFEPLAVSTVAARALKGGATTISQCCDAATNGNSLAINARASAWVLYIFQLPAITGRRMGTSNQSIFLRRPGSVGGSGLAG